MCEVLLLSLVQPAELPSALAEDRVKIRQAGSPAALGKTPKG